MNYCIQIYTASNNILKRFTTSIWDNFGIYLSLTFKDAKYNCFTACTTTSFTFNPSCSIVTFINFYLTFKWRFKFTILSNAISHSFNIPVNSVPIEVGNCGDLNPIQIQRKQLNKLAKFPLRNSRTLNILVSPCHYSNLQRFSCA